MEIRTRSPAAALALSIKVSLWATGASLPIGIWVAFLLARRRFPGRQILNAVVHLPLVLPPVVTGYLLLLTFGRRGSIRNASYGGCGTGVVGYGGCACSTGCVGRHKREARIRRNPKSAPHGCPI